MAPTHPLPPGLEPAPHEHGLASGDLEELTRSIVRGWDLFLEAIQPADLDLASRKSGWTGREIVARLGAWDFGRRLSDLLADAHDGEASTYDADAVDEEVRARTADLPTGELVAAVARARDGTAEWLHSDGPATWGLVATSSPLGPLPMLTVMNAMTYQLAIATLDLEMCGAEVPDALMHIGLVALVDTTGAMAARKRVNGSFAAITPELTVAAGSRDGHWRTAILDKEPAFGPGVVAPARTVLDVTSGRANVGHLYRSGELHVRDLTGMLRLAPVLEGIPGVPPLGAVGRAMSVVDAVGGLFGRLRG